MKRHGHSRRGKISATYSAWRNMIQRCTRPQCPIYPYYGGRGITVCDSWMRFDNFLLDMGVKPDGLTLERKDNNAGYCKANCIWDTRKHQSANTRRNRYLTYGGRTLCLAAWARELGVNPKTFRARVESRGLEGAFKASIIKPIV